MAFMQIINEAKDVFSRFEYANKIRFDEKGYTVYYQENLVLKFCKYAPELAEAYRVNGSRAFSLTRAQVTGCFWNTK